MTRTVTVEEVLSAGPGGGAIFRAMTEDGRKVRILAERALMPRPPVPGEVWKIGGTVRRHPIHGPQVHAQTALLDRPSGRLIIDALARNPAFPGIGPQRAKRLWEAFGEDLIRVLDERDADRLSTVVGADLARVLIDGWETMAVEAAVYGWLDRHGLTPKLANRLIDIYGAATIRKLEDNPYRLISFVDWARTDCLARSLQIAEDDPRRLIAAAETACHRRLDQSHTWTAEADLEALAGQIAGRAELGRRALDLAVDDHALSRVDGGLQGVGPWSMERFVAERVAAMLDPTWRSRQHRLGAPASARVLRDLLDAFQADESFRLNTGQQDAVLMALTTPLSVLAGGAGVGKTTALRAIAHLADRTMRPIWLMALSGRAAKRMEEATGRPATTIAAFLAKAAAGHVDDGADWLLVIDEASMLDLPTLYRILRFVQPGHALLLVGDPGQLPPIGFGLTFHALAASGHVPRVELIQIHRQAAATGIPQLAAAIRDGRMPNLPTFSETKPGFAFVEAAPDAATDVILDLVTALGGPDIVRIVGATKLGPGGVRLLNASFHAALGDADGLGGFSVGEPVLWTRNDYDLGLRNGSLGQVMSTDGQVVVAWDDGLTTPLAAGLLKDLDHAYAITCHKAQGSQFRRVLVPVFRSRLLDRTLLYTAVTRAQEQVVLVGDREALAAAIAVPPAPERRMTAMACHLRQLAS